jgi:hypothetical protein
MADCLSAGTGSIPVSSAISLREIRLAARTLASRSSYEGSSPSSPAKGEHGIAAGASGFQPDDASSTLAARSKIEKGPRLRGGPRFENATASFWEGQEFTRAVEGSHEGRALAPAVGLEWLGSKQRTSGAKARFVQRPSGTTEVVPFPRWRSEGGGVAKTARHLPAKEIIGSAILPTASKINCRCWCSSVGRARAS